MLTDHSSRVSACRQYGIDDHSIMLIRGLNMSGNTFSDADNQSFALINDYFDVDNVNDDLYQFHMVHPRFEQKCRHLAFEVLVCSHHLEKLAAAIMS